MQQLVILGHDRSGFIGYFPNGGWEGRIAVSPHFLGPPVPQIFLLAGASYSPPHQPTRGDCRTDFIPHGFQVVTGESIRSEEH